MSSECKYAAIRKAAPHQQFIAHKLRKTIFPMVFEREFFKHVQTWHMRNSMNMSGRNNVVLGTVS